MRTSSLIPLAALSLLLAVACETESNGGGGGGGGGGGFLGGGVDFSNMAFTMARMVDLPSGVPQPTEQQTEDPAVLGQCPAACDHYQDCFSQKCPPYYHPYHVSQVDLNRRRSTCVGDCEKYWAATAAAVTAETCDNLFAGVVAAEPRYETWCAPVDAAAKGELTADQYDLVGDGACKTDLFYDVDCRTQPDDFFTFPCMKAACDWTPGTCEPIAPCAATWTLDGAVVAQPCPNDADCVATTGPPLPCAADDHCDTWCPMDGAGASVDPDCAAGEGGDYCSGNARWDVCNN